MPNPAAVLYEAYRRYGNDINSRNSLTGYYLLPWEMLPHHEQKAWWAVVNATKDLGTTPALTVREELGA